MTTLPLRVSNVADVLRTVQQAPREGMRHIVKALAKFVSRAPRKGERPEDVAIMFVDIVGSSRFSETLPPHKVMRILQSFHARMAALVAAHGGAIVSYNGDGLAAMFSARRSKVRAAANALNCALSMLSEIERWSAERASQGKPVIPIGIGIHLGGVVMGPIGIGRHVQRAMFGDSVNVAKRLESMTRTIGSPLVVSDAVVDAIKGDPAFGRPLLSGLQQQGPTEVRGRRSPVSIWILASAAAPVDARATPPSASSRA